MRINTGEYRIDFFDRYGGKLRDLEQSARCVTEAIEQGDKAIAANAEVASFIITRQIFNSLDRRLM